MTENEFLKIYSKLPSPVAIYYYNIKKKFKLSHERAYTETLLYAKSIGETVGEPGLPAHESNIKLRIKN